MKRQLITPILAVVMLAGCDVHIQWEAYDCKQSCRDVSPVYAKNTTPKAYNQCMQQCFNFYKKEEWR